MNTQKQKVIKLGTAYLLGFFFQLNRLIYWVPTCPVVIKYIIFCPTGVFSITVLDKQSVFLKHSLFILIKHKN